MSTRHCPVVRAQTSAAPRSFGPPPRYRTHPASLAVAWSLLYTVLGIWWALGGAGFPFGRDHDPDPAYSNLAALDPGTAAPVIAAWALAAGLASWVLRQGVGPRRLVSSAIAIAWVTAAALIFVVPDFRVLIRVAYLPVVLAGAPFGWPAGLDYGEFFQWTVMNQALCIAGGVALAATAVTAQRRLAGACVACGRREREAGWTSAEAAARWGEGRPGSPCCCRSSTPSPAGRGRWASRSGSRASSFARRRRRRR